MSDFMKGAFFVLFVQGILKAIGPERAEAFGAAIREAIGLW